MIKKFYPDPVQNGTLRKLSLEETMQLMAGGREMSETQMIEMLKSQVDKDKDKDGGGDGDVGESDDGDAEEPGERGLQVDKDNNDKRIMTMIKR